MDAGFTINKSKERLKGFLAEGSLPGGPSGPASVASNISAEQFIGMSGNGFVGICCVCI
jgi:SSS family solute:Na+ symporter